MKSIIYNISKCFRNTKIKNVGLATSIVAVLWALYMIGRTILTKMIKRMVESLPVNTFKIDIFYKERAKDLSEEGVLKGGPFTVVDPKTKKEETQKTKKDKFYQSFNGKQVDYNEEYIVSFGLVTVDGREDIRKKMKEFSDNIVECLSVTRFLDLQAVQVPAEHMDSSAHRVSVVVENISSESFSETKSMPEAQVDNVLKELTEINAFSNERAISLFSHENRSVLINKIKRMKNTKGMLLGKDLKLLNADYLSHRDPACNFNKLSWRKFPGKKIGDPSAPFALVLPGRCYEINNEELPEKMIDIVIAFKGNIKPIIEIMGNKASTSSLAFLRKLGECVEKANEINILRE
ncbi:MAG: hypothetical protein KAH32_05350 [Chlamydiia bacterium]|nr:hypothetical protein [Chlamydiia bacterium]